MVHSEINQEFSRLRSDLSHIDRSATKTLAKTCQAITQAAQAQRAKYFNK